MNSNPLHQKHTKLQRSKYGRFGRREWAFLGAPCGLIQSFTGAVIEQLGDGYRLAYLDADHAGDEAEATDTRLAKGAVVQYTDKISHHRFEWSGQSGPFQFRPLFDGCDALLINGNHFEAAQQIVFIDPRKEESLQRKLDRLTDVQAFVLAHGQNDIYDFLKEAVPNWAELPKVSIDAPGLIAQIIGQQLEAAIVPLNGLVLAGGKSQRMGQDKALLDYHGMPQQEHLYQLLSECCADTFLSLRPEQDEPPFEVSVIRDTFTGLGPMGAILSAFRQAPDSAWLVVAVDLPLVDAAVLDELIGQRNPSKVATAFHNPATDFPEPLIAIWEPRAYPVLLQFLAQGYSCPRKVLINSDMESVEIDNPIVLRNANRPEDVEAIRKLMK